MKSKKNLVVILNLTFLDNELIRRKDIQCMTKPESPLNPSTPCILPFKLSGRLHNECLLDITTGNHWCPTELGHDGEFKFGEGKYGFCSLSCPPFRKNAVDRPTNEIPTVSSNNVLGGKKSKLLYKTSCLSVLLYMGTCFTLIFSLP